MSKQAAATHGPLILWVDGVGGFLLCLGDMLTLGQAGAEPLADIPLVADVSRHHATLRRDGGGYWLEAERSATVNHAPARRTLLRTGDRITLGDSCQLLFQQTEPLSASARLAIVSGHRFAHPVDAVLLMAETLIFDRTPGAHVPVPDLRSRVILFRHGDHLALRAQGTIKVNGQAQRERATLALGVPVTVEDLMLTLEAV